MATLKMATLKRSLTRRSACRVYPKMAAQMPNQVVKVSLPWILVQSTFLSLQFPR